MREWLGMGQRVQVWFDCVETIAKIKERTRLAMLKPEVSTTCIVFVHESAILVLFRLFVT